MSPRTALRHLRLLPAAVGVARNWLAFLHAYWDQDRQSFSLHTRSGLDINLEDRHAIATAYMVFVQREYGDIAPDWTVVDVGAHVGVAALYAADQGPAVKVYALEPSPESYQALNENVTRNRLEERITTARIAMAGVAESRVLYSGKSSTSNSLYPNPGKGCANEVECVTLEGFLDQYELERTDLLKMDCEGAEFEVLGQASAQCLARIDRLRFEYHTYVPGADLDALFDHLRECGFTLVHHDAYALGQQGLVWFDRHPL